MRKHPRAGFMDHTNSSQAGVRVAGPSCVTCAALDACDSSLNCASSVGHLRAHAAIEEGAWLWQQGGARLQCSQVWVQRVGDPAAQPGLVTCHTRYFTLIGAQGGERRRADLSALVSSGKVHEYRS